MTPRHAYAIAVLVLLAGCGKPGKTGEPARDADVLPEPALRPAGQAPKPVSGQWSLAAGVLAFVDDRGTRAVSVSCSGGKTLRVTLPAARRIASEDRLSFGGGGDVEALAADARGSGGVSAAGPVPAALGAMLRAGPGASYGAVAIGPLPPVPAAQAEAFVAACRKPAAAPSPCQVQDGAALDVAPRRVVGTEPFWGATIAGRCVTYSTPDDPAGTRVWTRVRANGDQFVGALGGRPFHLTIARGTCSDGMSDTVYPMRATLMLGAEERRGCALPL